MWCKFLAQQPHERLAHLKRIVRLVEEANPKMEKSTRSLRKFLSNLLNREDVANHHKAPSAYNLHNKKPNFKNNYGWSKNVDESDYSPLRQSGNGVYLVNLSPVNDPHIFKIMVQSSSFFLGEQNRFPFILLGVKTSYLLICFLFFDNLGIHDGTSC